MAQKIGSPPAAGADAELVDFVVGSIRKAPEARTPFLHLLLRDVFPDDVYASDQRLARSRLTNSGSPTCRWRRSRSAARTDSTCATLSSMSRLTTM